MPSPSIMKLLDIGGKLEIIGSYKEHLKGTLKYPSDVDLQEYVFVDDAEGFPAQKAYDLLVGVLKKIHKAPKVFLTDIKAGTNRVGNPIKWTFKEFMEEEPSMIFHQKSIIKLDVVVVNSKKLFEEYSVNYYFELQQDTYANPKTYYTFTKKEVEDSLRLDIQKLQLQGNDFKALKRRYNLLKLQGRETGELLTIINSPLGELYQQISKLSLIQTLIESPNHKPSKELIRFNLEALGVSSADRIPMVKAEYMKKLSVLLDKAKMPAKKGGAKLHASLLKKLNQESGKTKNWDMSSFGYANIKDLSSPRFQVYVKPPTAIEYGEVISYVRGTKTKTDVIVDIGLALNYRGDRFKNAETAQKKVVKKYGAPKGESPKYRLFIVGSSLGGSIAEWLGKKKHLTKGFVSHDIITIGKPVTPVQLLTGDEPGENQTDVRQEYDPVSFLKPLQPHENDVMLESEHGVLSPLKNHIGESVMSHHEIKDEMIGTARKLPVKNLRRVVVLLRSGRQNKKGGASFAVTGLKKKELQDKAEYLIRNHKDVGDKIFGRTMAYINEVHRAAALRKALK